MPSDIIPPLYTRYCIEKGDERLGLFRLLAGRFGIKRGLYPGSFVHITPSFVIPEMVYADADRRCPKFFSAPETAKFIQSRAEYEEPPVFRFHSADFTKGLPEEEESFDLLISLYAGFISYYCKKHLKPGGILVANNSHGDSSLAYLDNDFTFIGVVKRSGEKFTYSDQNLDSYFQTKSGSPIDQESIILSMKGPGFTKTVYAYVFKKLK
jgi:hypothetical protein